MMRFQPHVCGNQNSIDADANGIIDAGEFSHMLATMEREHNLIRFH